MAFLTTVIHFVFCLLICSASAQAPQNPLKDFCRRYGHQTTIIDRKLYIDGGWVYANPIPQNPIPTMNQDLIYSDLDQSNNSLPTQYANLTKNSTVPDVAGGILWPDEVNKVFWLYGGEFSSAPSSFELWGYDTILNQWNMSNAAQTASSVIQRVSYGAGATLGNVGFYYGGYLNNNTNPLWTGPPLATSGMIMLNLDSGILSNNTGYDSIGRAEGVMVSIPASASGMLVYFGGVLFPHNNSSEVAMEMTEILLYDSADAKWFSQIATGEVPANRRKFCAGATWADDQSSYNIYIYGGFGFGDNATGFDDVYILTLPTFEWIKWYPTTSVTPSPHGILTCNVVDMAQMIVMGGNFTNSTDCDVPSGGGQHNLNLGQEDSDGAMWYKYMPQLTEYSVPSAIVSAVGGSSGGGATSTSPVDGFGDAALSVYFGEKAQFTSRTPTRYIPTSTSTASTTSASSPNSKSDTGAIVGGVIGGVGGLMVITGSIWWFYRKVKSTTATAAAAAAAAANSNTLQQQQQQLQHGVGSWQSPGDSRVLQGDPNHGNKTYVSPIAVPSGAAGHLPAHFYPGELTATPISPLQQLQHHEQAPRGYSLPYQQYAAVQQCHSGDYFPPASEMGGASPPTPSAHEMPVRGMTPGMRNNNNHHLHQPVAQKPVVGIADQQHDWEEMSHGTGTEVDSRSQQSTRSPTTVSR